MEEIKKSNRGGKREGAGRPKSDIETVTVSFLMEKELSDLLRNDSNIKNRGRFLNNAIKFALSNPSAFKKFIEKQV